MPSRDLARAAAFARMSEDIMGEGDERSTLQRVVDRCVAAVPACDHASVSLHRRKGSDRVRHNSFGVGVVVSCDLVPGDQQVTVAFPEKGVKKLLQSFARLEPVA